MTIDEPTTGPNEEDVIGTPVYAQDDQGIHFVCQPGTKRRPRQLTNFQARGITNVFVRQEGQQPECFVEIEAVLGDNRRTGLLSFEQFSAMRWHRKLLGPGAKIFPGCREHARVAIQVASKGAPEVWLDNHPTRPCGPPTPEAPVPEYRMPGVAWSEQREMRSKLLVGIDRKGALPSKPFGYVRANGTHAHLTLMEIERLLLGLSFRDSKGVYEPLRLDGVSVRYRFTPAAGAPVETTATLAIWDAMRMEARRETIQGRRS